MSVEVGVGYVSVVPEARGFGRLLNQQISGESARVGTSAGQDAGDGFLGGLGGKLKAGVAGVAVAGGALFAAGFAEAVEQDKATAKLGASLGLSEKDTARAGKIAGSIYAKGYGESIDQVDDSLKALQQNGVAALSAPKKELTGLSSAALNLAEVFDADVGESTKAVGQLIRTGLVKNGKEGFDLLTAGFQSGADKAGDLIDTVNEYSTQWRKAGLDGATAIGLINQGLQAGARDGDVVADSIKEFTIRAVDGSKTTADGWKALGLNADDMAAKFAKGGKAANGVLALTLDRLRGIKDPVKQSQAAVALFGTQAEDLGQALYSLDPTTAAKGIGKVGGAAGKMGKTLHNTASNDIEVFKRQALQGLANFASKYALPALRDFGSFLTTYVLPPAQTVGGALLDYLVPAVRGVGDALAGGVQWVKDYGAWLLPLGVAIGGIAVVAGASAIGTWAMTAAFTVYRGVILATTAVTRGWAIAQGVLNAVMSANPIGLIIVGILALGTALVVAYKKSETFRAIVQGAWAGIQAAAMTAWNGFIKPALSGIWTAIQAVGTAATWLWSSVLSPVFSAIALAAKVLFTVVAVLVIAPIVIAFRTLGAVGSWLWTNALQPAFSAIGAGATWLWNNAIGPAFRGIGALISLWWTGVKVIFGYFKAGVQALGAVGMWLWHNALQPAFQGIVTVVGWFWGGVKVTFGYVKAGIQALGAAGSWLWHNALQPAFTGISSAASVLWSKGLKPAFDAAKTGVKLVGDAFGTAKDAIGTAFGKIQDITKKPVNFVIDSVYSHGIKAVWDKVAGFVGLGKLPAAPKLLADGGRTHGGVPGKDSIPALMMADEFVVKRSSARKLGFGTLNYINQYGELPVQRFAGGGIVGDVAGWIGDKASKIGGAVMDGVDFLANPGKLWDKATKFIRDKIAQIGQNRFAQMIGKVPIKMLSSLKDKVVNSATSMFGGSSGDIGGSGVKRWSSVVLQALKLVGQPASLLPTVLRRMNQESGGNPRAINNWDINARNGTPSKGLMQVIDPTFNAYAGKLRGRGVWDPLANIYASMRYAMSRYGSLASAYNRAGGYANGGRPRPGEVAWVGENGPELLQFGGGQTVLDSDSSISAVGAAVVRGMARSMPQSVPAAAAVRAALGSAGGQQSAAPAGNTYNLYPRTLDMTVRDLEVLQRRQDALARVGRPR
ncbi:phage tail tape measure protein [Streptomyces sp. NBC_00038]|uniref:phage tail tape measure protein n=1 Tax=Streptomyces sp. NBC_00038 TaxID=2903615 RepID=UPI0022560AE8|nr:phage tail tape measure protein [Streptomyces sp. NBC_00038]MCX5562712.1 phage tail tape measure protein [Streptomyces sp. NBC_00038]MCX5563638.1 phage tail tape measure protein [Streptomyces sp. NBC_00038]